MTQPSYRDAATRLFTGDARDVLTALPDRSADCVVTSPPYYGLRDYAAPGQYGHEPTLTGYLDHLRGVFTELHRVLTDTGTCWLVLGDAYAANSEGSRRGAGHAPRQPAVRPPTRLPAKNLLGVPWRVAFALQRDGWILRNAIIWAKPNAMPESVRDRLSARHEYIFLLVKQRHYFFDLDPLRVAPTGRHARNHRAHPGTNRPATAPGNRPPADTERADPPPAAGRHTARTQTRGAHGAPAALGHGHEARHGPGRNPGDVWPVNTTPSGGAHVAVFPIDIPWRCIAAGCRPGGTVLDPFSGAATTGIAAHRLGHPYIGIDLRADYHHLAVARLHNDPRGRT